MKRKLLVAVGMILHTTCVITLTNDCLAEKWKGITPYHTTKREVEKKMKKYKVTYTNECDMIYADEFENVNISYVCFPYYGDKRGVANVPKFAVNVIVIYYKKTLLLTQLKINMKNYKRFTTLHTDGYLLEDDKAGHLLHINNGNVISATFRAPRKEIEKRECK